MIDITLSDSQTSDERMLRRSLSTLKHVAMARTPPKDPLIVVLGATGTGKSQVALLETRPRAFAKTHLACGRSRS